MFKPKVRSVLTAAVAGACFSSLLASQTEPAHRDFPSTAQGGRIRVFNLARVPKRDLSQAETEVTRIFAKANMEVHWAEGSVDDSASLVTDFSANNSSLTGCNAPRHSSEVRVQLLPRTPHGVAAEILGLSLPCAKFGIDSTIYIDHCERVTYQTPVSFTTVLAYAIAHELGHVLLRSSEHSRTGLMRARWDKSAWGRAMQGDAAIDREQARRMRIELFRMESLAPADIRDE